MPTNTSEKGLEDLIVAYLTGQTTPATGSATHVGEPPVAYGGAGYLAGTTDDYDREHALDTRHFRAFLEVTQPALFAALDWDNPNPVKSQFFARVRDEIGKRGIVDVLRQGVKFNQFQAALFYGSPSPGNTQAAARYAENRFSVTRQLRYSKTNPALALDLCVFLNGLPVFTFELKNSLTKQTVVDAVEQYKQDRDPKELLFQFKRCLSHFAVDDQNIRFCTRLEGDASWFLPFDRGHNGGAGNPPNPHGLMTDYLWREVLQKNNLSELLECFARVVRVKNPRTGKERESQIFPRYHQWNVVRQVLAHVRENGVGQKYLIQHSAGSGKSNSIAWLAHQLVDTEKNGKTVFDSILVVTDRRNLDKQTDRTIKDFAEVKATVGHADGSGDLRTFIQGGKKIIITTVQKFPYILDEIGTDHQGRNFAIIIDEAHSSQSGSTSAKMQMALAGQDDGDDESFEDAINRIIETKKLLPNASYFAFTATPKGKTLEMFGTPFQSGAQKQFAPFHSYTMRQAIQEGFILDVLSFYTPIKSYYRLEKVVSEDPEFDTKKARKKLRRYVENHAHAIGEKSHIIVEHFLEQVIAKKKIGGQARAMVVTNGIARAIEYFHAIKNALKERNSLYLPVVAFTGEHEYGGQKVTEATLNGFPSNHIEERIQDDPYRILICADKFQTGYDEPLLHTMYVDKTLAGIKAVQTLSRLNRAHAKKRDTFVLDFINDPEVIQAAFQEYYQTTILSGETDPNRLHDLQATLDNAQVYTTAQVNDLVERYLSGADRDTLDPILDTCVVQYRDTLDENAQVEFKGTAKAFLRNYNFLSAILPYSLPEWEKLSVFLTFLVPKLPAPQEEDLSQGILESIDMDSYRAEKNAALAIALSAEDAALDPSEIGGSGHKPEPELDRLSNIIDQFNALFGDIPFDDKDKVMKLITEEIPAKVAADKDYQNAMQNPDRENARQQHDHALEHALISFIKDHTEFYKQFKNSPEFHRFVSRTSFENTYQPPVK